MEGRKKVIGGSLVLLLLCFFAVRVSGEVLVIYPTDDVTLNSSHPELRYGMGGTGGTKHYTGYYDGGQSRIYMKFDLSPVAALAAPTGYELRFNSVTVLIGANNVGGTGLSFNDALYAVADTDWTETTLPNGYLPTLGNTLVTWAFVPWHHNVISSDGLMSFVVDRANSVSKKAAFCIAESSFDVAHNYHAYYGTAYGLPMVQMQVNYSFVDIAADLNSDGAVNISDIGLLVQNWLYCIDPANEDCEKPWQ